MHMVVCVGGEGGHRDKTVPKSAGIATAQDIKNNNLLCIYKLYLFQRLCLKHIFDIKFTFGMCPVVK